MAFVKVFFWGMLISLLGTIPLSPLNVAALQISLQEGVRNAMYFSVGTLVTEMIYVRISLIGINWIQKQKKLFKWLEWFIFILIVAFAAGSFFASAQKHATQNVILNNNINRFSLGVFMSAVNVMQIPFWLGWSTVLFSKKILMPQKAYYNIYTVSIGVGTFLANCIFIFGGVFIAQKLNTSQHTMNLILGWIFTATAAIQLIKILRSRNDEKKLETSILKNQND